MLFQQKKDVIYIQGSEAPKFGYRQVFRAKDPNRQGRVRREAIIQSSGPLPIVFV